MARIGRRTGAVGTVLILGFAVGGSALATGFGMSCGGGSGQLTTSPWGFSDVASEIRQAINAEMATACRATMTMNTSDRPEAMLAC